MVGTSRCDVPARSEAKGGACVANHALPLRSFRHLTLRSVTGTAQRAIPTILFLASLHLCAFALLPFDFAKP